MSERGEEFRSGDLLERRFTSTRGAIGVLAEVEIDGGTLHLRDLIVYPIGTERLDLGVRELRAAARELLAEVHAAGFVHLRISAIRYSGASAGRAVDLMLDLASQGSHDDTRRG